jgi:hypothetical protein
VLSQYLGKNNSYSHKTNHCSNNIKKKYYQLLETVLVYRPFCSRNDAIRAEKHGVLESNILYLAKKLAIIKVAQKHQH